jgi:hypothetical protein
MKRDDLSDDQAFVKIREGTWRFRRRHGTVAATVPIPRHTHFSELAVLVEVPEFDVPRFAARAAGTEDWVHYYQLQPWMVPVVREFLAMTEKYARVAEIVKEANRVLA